MCAAIERVFPTSFLWISVKGWIGLNDFAKEGTFVLTSSPQVAYPTFWMAREPNDSDGHTEDGASIYHKK